MTIVKSYNIKATDDLELKILRESPLRYHIAFDDQKKPDGIIFSIPGFGADSDINYQLNLIEHISKTYNLIAVCVEYHCFFSRIRTGASYGLNPYDMEIFLDIIKRYGIELDPDHLDFDSVVTQLNDYVTTEKQKDPKYSEYKENIFATILPKKDEYQNFGILQTIDIITVLSHLKSLGYADIINKKPLFAFGSSHGAYISNLLMKFAPNTFDAIIENSTYVKPPLKYIVGQEHDTKSSETLSCYKDSILLHAFTLTNWTKDQSSPRYFSDSAYEIRDLLDSDQLEQFFNYKNKTELISYHCIEDTIASFEDKERYIEALKKSNCKVDFNSIKTKEQIDGELLKTFSHAMGMSNKKILEKHLPFLLKKYANSTPTDFCIDSKISYTTSLHNIYTYDFKHSVFSYS